MQIKKIHNRIRRAYNLGFILKKGKTSIQGVKGKFGRLWARVFKRDLETENQGWGEQRREAYRKEITQIIREQKQKLRQITSDTKAKKLRDWKDKLQQGIGPVARWIKNKDKEDVPTIMDKDGKEISGGLASEQFAGTESRLNYIIGGNFYKLSAEVLGSLIKAEQKKKEAEEKGNRKSKTKPE